MIKRLDKNGNNPKRRGDPAYLTESDTDEDNVRINGRQFPKSIWTDHQKIPTQHQLILKEFPNGHHMARIEETNYYESTSGRVGMCKAILFDKETNTYYYCGSKNVAFFCIQCSYINNFGSPSLTFVCCNTDFVRRQDSLVVPKCVEAHKARPRISYNLPIQLSLADNHYEHIRKKR